MFEALIGYRSLLGVPADRKYVPGMGGIFDFVAVPILEGLMKESVGKISGGDTNEALAQLAQFTAAQRHRIECRAPARRLGTMDLFLRNRHSQDAFARRTRHHGTPHRENGA